MATRSAVHLAAIAVVGVLLCGSATVVNAKPSFASMTVTKRVDTASPKLLQQSTVRPGDRVVLNPQPLPPRLR